MKITKNLQRIDDIHSFIYRSNNQFKSSIIIYWAQLKSIFECNKITERQNRKLNQLKIKRLHPLENAIILIRLLVYQFSVDHFSANRWQQLILNALLIICSVICVWLCLFSWKHSLKLNLKCSFRWDIFDIHHASALHIHIFGNYAIQNTNFIFHWTRFNFAFRIDINK